MYVNTKNGINHNEVNAVKTLLYQRLLVWSRRGSNPRLLPCRGSALPAELRNRFSYWTITIIAHLLNKSTLFIKIIKNNDICIGIGFRFTMKVEMGARKWEK